MNELVEPDDGQAEAIGRLLGGLRAGQTEQVLAGAAGTGKTTVLRHLIRMARAEGWITLQLAPTNKAALRMHEASGLPAQTIHSAGYKRFVETDDGDLLTLDPKAVAEEGARTLVIVDEASMLGARIVTDLRANLPAGCSVIYVGDPYQLPPVKDAPGVDLQHPTAMLTKVHRQAAENPVLAYATAIREGWGPAWMGQWVQALAAGAADPRLRVFYGHHGVAAQWWEQEQAQGHTDLACVTWQHVDRRGINAHMRGGKVGVHVGDRLVALENYKDLGIVNGDVLTVDRVRPVCTTAGGPVVKVTTDSGRDVMVAPGQFDHDGLWRDVKATLRPPGKRYPLPVLRATWGYCLTVHQSQGSQWDHVLLYIGSLNLLFIENPQHQTVRLIYTAVTRAKKSLTIVAGA